MGLRLFLTIYSIIGTVLLPVALLIALMSKRGRHFLAERFGFWKSSTRPTILIHGASLGEVKGVIPLAKALRSKYPDYEVIISSTSTTGREAAENSGFVGRIIPLDIYWLYIIAFADLNLKLCIISETEIWPGLISWLKFNRIPWGIINGRISDKSWGEYSALSPFLRPFITEANFVGVADQKSYNRFIQLGAAFERIKKIGNTKYDLSVAQLEPLEREKLRRELVGNYERVVILGSIRPGEDAIWNPVIKNILQKYSNVSFIVAPRHPEKFDYFANSLRDASIAFARRRDGAAGRLLLLDSLGELAIVYGCGDIAFVGGTVEPFGGHNPLEAMTQGCAVLTGQSTYVISEIVEALSEAQALLSFNGAEECQAILEELLSNHDRLKSLQENAHQVAKEFFGATERAVDMISGVFSRSK